MLELSVPTPEVNIVSACGGCINHSGKFVNT